MCGRLSSKCLNKAWLVQSADMATMQLIPEPCQQAPLGYNLSLAAPDDWLFVLLCAHSSSIRGVDARRGRATPCLRTQEPSHPGCFSSASWLLECHSRSEAIAAVAESRSDSSVGRIDFSAAYEPRSPSDTLGMRGVNDSQQDVHLVLPPTACLLCLEHMN